MKNSTFHEPNTSAGLGRCSTFVKGGPPEKIAPELVLIEVTEPLPKYFAVGQICCFN